MVTAKSGLKVLAVAVVAWGISNWALDHDAGIEHANTPDAAAQVADTTAAVAPPASPVVVETASPVVVETAPSAQLIAPPMLTEVNAQALIAALEAATTTLKMAAATLQLAVQRHADTVSVTQQQARSAAKSLPASASTATAAPKSPTVAFGAAATDSHASSPGSAALLFAEADEAQYHLAQGRQALWHGKDQDALTYFRKAAALAPDNTAIQGELGNLLYRMGHWPEAVNQFFAVSELHLAAGEYQQVFEMLPLFHRLAPAKANELSRRLRHAQEPQS